MEEERMPRPGEIYNHFTDKPYQIVAVAIHSETGEHMVVYQALYGEFKTYVRPLQMFLSEVDRDKHPEAKQKKRFELRPNKDVQLSQSKDQLENPVNETEQQPIIADEQQNQLEESQESQERNSQEGKVNVILLEFLEAASYSKKLNVLTGKRKHLNDRLINDMAVSLDCTVEEGPLEKRIEELIFCLKAICRFEDRRLR